MIRPAIIFSLLIASCALAQEPPAPAGEENSPSPSPSAPAAAAAPTTKPMTTTTLQKRGFFGRVFHPFSSSDVLPKYNDKRLRGLVLDLQVSPQPVRLSEVRQLEVKLTVSNMGSRVVQLDFPTDQRIEIQLLNSGDVVLTKWSDNHAVMGSPGTELEFAL